MPWLQIYNNEVPSHLVELSGANIRYVWRELSLTVALVSGMRLRIVFNNQPQMQTFVNKLLDLLQKQVQVIDARAESLECAAIEIV